MNRCEDADAPVGARVDQIQREQLSALIDGELRSDQARFVIARLEHDVELSGRHERWQLAGDVLRGQLGAVAPVDFSARVMAALPPAVPARTPRRLPWAAGGALAAGLALVAVIALPPAAPPPAAAVAQQPAQAVPAPAAPALPALPAATAEAVVAVAAVPAAVPRPVPDVRPRPVVAAAAPAPSLLADVPAPPPRSDVPSPFSLPAPGLPSRPWPRSQLPGASGFNAGLPAPQAGPFAPTLDPQQQADGRWPLSGSTR